MEMTQEIMAERLNVSIGNVSQVERGVTKISLDLLGAIASFLNCDVALFIAESAGEYTLFSPFRLLSLCLHSACSP